jgi:two-component system nitrate/nitrite sensor histidine kinase NarX
MRITGGTVAGVKALENWTQESALNSENHRNVELKWQGRIQTDPLTLVDGSPVGELRVMLHDGVEFGEHHRSAINHITHQVALFMEMERLHKTLKFDAVIEERTRLAREIHDSLAQTLAFLKLTAAQMQNYLGQGDYPRLNQAIKQSYQALTEAYIDTRKTIDDLRLDPQRNLSDWLAQIANDFERDNAISIQAGIADDLPVMPSEIQAQLLRIIQEALNNVRKHAHATQVKLDIHRWDQDLIFQIQDDGCGFLPEEVPELSRYGLRGMRERAEAIGADFQVISQPGQGTTVLVRLPVPNQEVTG